MNLSLNPPSPDLIAFICAEPKRKVKAPPSGLNLSHNQDFSSDDVRDMLACLNPDMNYQDWLNIGMALHAGGYPVNLWDEWSRKGTKYIPGECANKWAGFDGSGGVTMGTLIHLAKQARWSPSNTARTLSGGVTPICATDGLKREYEAFTMGALLADKSPMPQDLIAPRVLTPAGLLLIAGAPKVGKSDFVLSLLVHAAAGIDFLGFTFARPLRIFYFQAEIQYHYLRERLKNMGIPADTIRKANENLVITPQMKIILNDDGMDSVYNLMAKYFSDDLPDIIVIDPIRNVFDGGPVDSGLGENDNQAMLYFLQNRVEVLRDAINPDAGIILVHHTKKLSKQGVKEDPFQAISGASSLRGYYTSGMVMFRPDEGQPVRCVVAELRNGPGLPPIFIDKVQGQWQEVDNSHVRLIKDEYGHKLDAERERRHDVILQLIEQEALQGNLYTVNAFAEKYEGRNGLGSKTSVNDRISVLMTKGHIKCYRAAHPATGQTPGRSKLGYMCIKDMRLGPAQERVTEDGEVLEDFIPIKPTHYKTADTGAVMAVENPETWVYPAEE